MRFFGVYSAVFGLFLAFLAVFSTGCADKNLEYNKPAIYWYEQMLQEIQAGNLEKADDNFASLQSEHLNSPLVREAMLIMGHAHMSEKEYILAAYYFDEYQKRYATPSNADHIAFLKLLTNFYGFNNYSKDQTFMLNSLHELDEFLASYPTSRYLYFVKHMKVKFELGQVELNNAIANVYDKLDKEFARDEYLSRNPAELMDLEVKKSHVPWYVWIFNW